MVKKAVFAKMAPDHFSPSRNFESFRGSKTEKNVFFGTFGRFSALTTNRTQKRPLKMTLFWDLFLHFFFTFLLYHLVFGFIFESSIFIPFFETVIF